MSLNFLKNKSDDSSLNYQSILNDLKTIDKPGTDLDIDRYIQKENIHLQHQEYYQDTKYENVAPKRLDDTLKYTSQDAREFVNILTEISKSMPDMKATTIENRDKVNKLISENKQTIDNIKANIQTL